MRDDKYYVGLFYLLFYEFMNIVFILVFKNFMEFILSPLVLFSFLCIYVSSYSFQLVNLYLV